MLDSKMIQHLRRPLNYGACVLDSKGIKANRVTVIGFLVGGLALPSLVFELPLLALFFILLNRIFDGLDGALARIQGPTDAGGFLDISLDFIFYSLVPFAFVLANPSENAVAGAFLIFSFVGTGSSFLAFSSLAFKKGISDPVYKNKSIYYMTGLTEGTETLLCFVFMCLFPAYFSEIAFVFACLCWFTTMSRIYNGFKTLEMR